MIKFKLPPLYILDKYIIKKFLGTFFFTLGIFVTIAVVFDVSEKLDDFLEKQAPITAILFDYYLNFIPYYCSKLSPLLIFIAVIFFTAKMADNTEIVAILSSGVSFRRLLYPYFVAALVLACITFVFNGYLIPYANKTRIKFENRYIKNPYVFRDRNIHMQLDPQTLIYMETYDNTEDVGFKFSLEHYNNRNLTYKLMSQKIVWDSTINKWSIRDYSIRYINGTREKIVRGAKLDTVLDLHPNDFERKDNNMETMPMGELNKFIEKEQMRGNATVELFVIEKYSRYAVPFSTFILTLIGVSLSSRKVRGGIGIQLGIGIGFSFAYIILMQFTTAFVVGGGMPPIIAVWIPNAIFGIIGLYLLKIAPK